MLSAVAARKAAQSAKQTVSAPQAPSEISQTDSAPTPGSRPPPSSSKRKPSSQSTPAVKKKKKKTQEKAKTTRYFHEPEPQNIVVEPDVITIDSDVSEAEEDLESLDAIDFSIADFHSKVEPSPSGPVKRAWSPSAPILDSSDEEEADAEPSTSSSSTEADSLSTFRPIRDQNVFLLTAEDLSSVGYGDDFATSALTVLNPGDTLSFIGAYRFSILQGSVTVLGTTFRPSLQTHNVFAPRSSPIPMIRAASSSTSTPTNFPLPPRLKLSVQPDATILVLHELRSNVRGLERICGVFEDVFRLPRRQAPLFDFGIRGLYLVSEPIKNVEAFRSPPSWNAALSSVSAEDGDSGVYVVQGAKKSGKSTFARTLSNQLLSKYRRVAYLECDLGQSEFTPGGMVALNIIESPLLGPPFTHPGLPITAHYIGATSPKSSPSHYLAAIQACTQVYRLDLKRPIDDGLETEDERISDKIPLIVNTMGWTKGLGADLLVKIHEIVQPTRIFEVEAPVFEDWTQPAPAPPREGSVHVDLIKPIPQPPNAMYTAADLRTLAILSYFHAIFPSHTKSDSYRQILATSWNTSLPLCAQVPYEVDMSTAIDQVILTGAGAEDVVPSEVLGVLNIALVGLVSCEPGLLDMAPVVPGSKVHYAQGVSPPSPMSSDCLGLALIRSVSPQSDALHLLTPTPPGLLEKVRLLVKGEMELPVWGMLDHREEEVVAGVEKSKVPYLQWDKPRGLGAEKRKVRRNLMRKGQM